MLFNTAEFVFIFLPLAVALHFLVARWHAKAAVVATALSSLAFYAGWNPPFVVLLAGSILVNFMLARAILAAKPARAGRILAFGIVFDLVVLGYFKYADFFASVFLGWPPRPADVPLALSFTTFVQSHFWSTSGVAGRMWILHATPCSSRSSRISSPAPSCAGTSLAPSSPTAPAIVLRA